YFFPVKSLKMVPVPELDMSLLQDDAVTPRRPSEWSLGRATLEETPSPLRPLEFMVSTQTSNKAPLTFARSSWHI
uniref:Uncharacterized protein n=1 Tax=Denticeps clupeoides TaxID=299321 RepID=A0AAY4ATG9_9TELE